MKYLIAILALLAGCTAVERGEVRTVMALHAIGPVPVADKYDRATDVALGPYWGFGQVYKMADAVEGERVYAMIGGFVPIGGTVESIFNYELIVQWDLPPIPGWSSSRIMDSRGRFVGFVWGSYFPTRRGIGVSSKTILKVWRKSNG